jgi:TonB family protein
MVAIRSITFATLCASSAPLTCGAESFDSPMRRTTVVVVAGVIAWTLWVPLFSALAQENSQRKVLTRVAPHYPELAKKMHVQGTVKVEVAIRPDGTVRSTRVWGGSPVLVQSVVDAVRQWRFAVSQSETTEIVQLTFADQ